MNCISNLHVRNYFGEEDFVPLEAPMRRRRKLVMSNLQCNCYVFGGMAW
jgi:hypothetical protein